MKRPPRPKERVAPSPGWTARRRLRHGDPKLTLPTKPLTPKLLGIEPDPELEELIAQLQQLDLENLRPGADVRRESFAIARHRIELLVRLEQSVELEETLSGHIRLRPKRRRGIFRWLLNDPDLPGLPFFLPLVPPKPRGTEWEGLRLDLHLGRLVDELEHFWVPIFHTSWGWRPTWKVMNSIQMRAVLGINASNFYELNRNTLIPGRLFPSSRYDTETVMRWVFRSGFQLFGVSIARD